MLTGFRRSNTFAEIGQREFTGPSSSRAHRVRGPIEFAGPSSSRAHRVHGPESGLDQALESKAWK